MSRAVVDAKEFSHAMSKISKILKKCAIPILEEVCLRIQNGRCTLTATDLETWLTAELPASGDDMFFVFRKTKDILRACSHFAGELTMEFSETRSGSKKAGKILLRCERRGAEFEVYDGADYPNMPQAPEGDAFSVSSARLSACVERVRYAAEKPSVSARPAAICVQFCGNRVYALDGTRLACDTLEGVSFPKPFLVRADVLAHLSAFGKEDMTVRIGSSHVLFASGNLRMLARLQGVDTYNVDAVIPKGYRESVTVKTADFVRELNYLKECSALTAKPYVRFAGEQLSIAASGGAFETGIEVRGRGDMVLGFDLYHMLDALKQFIDLVIIKVEREAGFAIGSRRLASRSQRYFFAHREDLHRIGSRVKCRMLAVGPRRCLVDCYGHDLDLTQREMRYAAIPDLRDEYHPGMELESVVKVYDPAKDELVVSIKETETNPTLGAERRHPVGSRRLAVISGKYGGGVFCNLPDGVVCMCNYSFQHEDSDFMVGENVMLVVQRYNEEKLQMFGKILSKWSICICYM